MQTLVEVLVELKQLGASDAPDRLTRSAARFADPRAPRADRQRFRAILHNCKRHGVASQSQRPDDFEAYLAGDAAYVRRVEPALGRRWVEDVDRLLGGSHG